MIVQYLAIAIFLAISIYACFDIKKAILIWLPFKLLFNDQIAVRYNSPGMSLVIAVDIALFIILIFKSNSKKLYKGKYPLLEPLVLYLISYGISTLFSIASFQASIIATVKYFASTFGVVYMAHRAFKSIKDIRFFTIGCIIVTILITLLALSENILKTNLWLDFVYFNSPYDPESNRMFYTPGFIEMRYGLVRSRSFFSFHIPFGFACVCLFWYLFYQYKVKVSLVSKSYLVISFVLLFAGVFMSNSKQAYLGLVLVVLSLLPPKQLFKPGIIMPVLFAMIAVIIIAPDYLNNFLSLTDAEVAAEGGGSTIELRKNQYAIATKMFLMRPIFGNGVASMGVLKNMSNFGGILGAESAWLKILPERGLLGGVTYIALYCFIYISMRKKMNHRVLAFYLFAIFVVEFAGGIKDMSLWAVVLLAVARQNEFVRKRRRAYYSQRLRDVQSKNEQYFCSSSSL